MKSHFFEAAAQVKAPRRLEICQNSGNCVSQVRSPENGEEEEQLLRKNTKTLELRISYFDLF